MGVVLTNMVDSVIIALSFFLTERIREFIRMKEDHACVSYAAVQAQEQSHVSCPAELCFFHEE